MFVLHEHDRPRHHFDLRLEEDGVLRSWAVPKGLPDDPRADRLAVAVDDHELEHATYTDEDKRIADSGWWELEDRNEKRFVFVLHGQVRLGPLRADPTPGPTGCCTGCGSSRRPCGRVLRWPPEQPPQHTTGRAT